MKWFRRKRGADAKNRRSDKRKHARLIDDFMPPEGIALKFEIAGIGARFGAQIADILICVLAIGAVTVLLGFTLDAPEDLLTSFATLGFFMIRAPYYILTELLWNGATLGKRLMGIRVLAIDGRGLTVHAITVRNLMKEAEVFVPGTLLLVNSDLDLWLRILTLVWIVIVLGVPLFNRRNQRLGDMIAGTYVIQRPIALLVPDLAAQNSTNDNLKKQQGFVFQPHQLEHYGAYELQTLEKILQTKPVIRTSNDAKRRAETLATIVDRIRTKIDFGEAVSDSEQESFLRAFYNAQRAHLEQRQLFGDHRADKHHSEGSSQ